ncbi:MAG: oligosaccharide flippase family protein [Actinomycetota bacterium]|nr:oligosaccharide flippase family protein [Actinomycetota bacterium]
MRDAESLVTSSLWVALARVLALVAFIPTNFILARLLGTRDFGRFAVIASVVVFAGYCATLGTNRMLLRDIAANRARGTWDDLARSQRTSSVVLMASIPAAGIITATIGLVVFRSWIMPAFGLALALAFLTGANALQTVAGDVLRGFGDIRVASFVEGRNGGVIQSLVFLVCLIPFIGHELTLLVALELYLAAFVIMLVPVSVRLRRLWLGTYVNSSTRVEAPRHQNGLRDFLLPSLALGSIQLGALLGSQIDLWIGGAALQPRAVSIFAGAARIMLIVGTPLAAVGVVVTPRLAALHARGHRAELERFARQAATLVVAPSLLVIIPILLFAGDTMRIFLGNGFGSGGRVLLWLTVGQLIAALTGVCGQLLAMTGHERDVVRVAYGILTAKLLIGFPVAFRFGVSGLAAVSSLTTAVTAVVLVAFAHKRLDVWTYPSFERGIFSLRRFRRL